MKNPFEELYKPYDSEKQAFRENWIGPEAYKHMEEALIAKYEPRPDGQPVEVYCTACPARFYTLKVAPYPNSLGKPEKGYEITTGSSMAKFAAELAGLIANGMIGFRPVKSKEDK
jgi:hypothetical protein